MDPGSAVQRLRAAPRPGNAGEVMNPSQIAQALLASGSDAIVAADRDGIIRHWNQGAERMSENRSISSSRSSCARGTGTGIVT